MQQSDLRLGAENLLITCAGLAAGTAYLYFGKNPKIPIMIKGLLRRYLKPPTRWR